jgi:predicted ATPase with chaperone activity
VWVATTQLNKSEPAYHLILKLAYTIVDLEDNEAIQPVYVVEALRYRPKPT